jgi:hypothetical protein
VGVLVVVEVVVLLVVVLVVLLVVEVVVEVVVLALLVLSVQELLIAQFLRLLLVPRLPHTFRILSRAGGLSQSHDRFWPC